MKRYLHLSCFIALLSIAEAGAATGSLKVEVGPKDAEWLNLYNEYKVGFKSAAKSDILAIEN